MTDGSYWAQEGIAGTNRYTEALSAVGGEVARAWGNALQAPRVSALCCAHQLATQPDNARVGVRTNCPGAL